MAMTQLLRAVAVGLALTATGWLLGCPSWTASMSYVAGMAAALMVSLTTVRVRVPAFLSRSGATSVG